MKKLVLSALALTLSVGVTVGSAAPANAGDPIDQTERWLNKQLTNGLVHNNEFDYDDYGLSIDVGLAFRALDEKKQARTVRKAIAKHVDSYTTGVDFMSSDIYANATAKAAAFAQVTGADASKFGGVDLVARLNKRVGNKKPISGRIQDKTTGDDFANTIGQAFAVQALATAKSKKAGEGRQVPAGAAVQAGLLPAGLHRRQDGGRPDLRRRQAQDHQRSGHRRDRARGALAARAPEAVQGGQGAIAKAVTWLTKHQAKNGSFGGGTATEAANANSTGLAAWALGAAGACKQAQQGGPGRVVQADRLRCVGRERRDRVRQGRPRRCPGRHQRHGGGPVAPGDRPGRAGAGVHDHRRLRLIVPRAAFAAAVLVTAAAGLSLPVAPATGATCGDAGGVSVVVDFKGLGGGTQSVCDPAGGGTQASTLFTRNGFDLTYAQRQPGYVCRVEAVPASDPCVNTSPASAYWGLWWSDGKTGTWSYSSLGVTSLKVPAGGSVAFAWDDVDGSVKPGVAPPKTAATAPTPTETPTDKPTPSPTVKPTPTSKPTPAPTAEATPSPTEESSTSPSAAPTPTATPSATPTASGTPTATSSPTPSDTPSPDTVEPSSAAADVEDDGLPGWVPVAVVAALFAASAGAVVLRRRRA